MLMRGDADQEPRQRLQHYLQAAQTAPPGHAVEREARLRRARFVVTLAGGAPISAAMRHDLLEAAAELEALDDPAKAAEAYRLAGDGEGEARALTSAGEVERLETLLTSEHARERQGRVRRQTAHELELLLTSGRRREAVLRAEEALRLDPDDRALRDQLGSLLQRRLQGPVVALRVRDRALAFALGSEPSELILGRSEGDLRVAAHAVSRRHLRFAREAGRFVVSDLGSTNGTTLRGVRLSGTLPVAEGLELKLGNEVPLRVAPSDEVPDCLRIDVAGRQFHVPLGPARLPIGDWRLGVAPDGWVELLSSIPSAYFGASQAAARATLLNGDAIGEARGGPAVVTIASVE